MKKMLAGAFLGSLLTSAVFLAPVFADGAKTQIEAWINTITLNVNGINVQSDNILYNDTTYVPLREISESLGQKVNWDHSNKTINIGENSPGQETPPVSNIRGNTSGNLANGGELAVGENGSLYISLTNHTANPSEEDGLYQLSPNQQAVKIMDRNPKSLNVEGNTLYFADNGIYRSDIDGKGLSQLTTTGNKVILADNWLYFSSDSAIYKMRKDGSERVELSTGRLIDVQNGYLFGVSGKILFRTDLNGTSRQTVHEFDNNFEGASIIENGFIYFTDLKSIYRIPTTGGQHQSIYTTRQGTILSFYVDNALWISEGGGGNHASQSLVKAELDGRNPQTIGEGGIQIYRASGDTYTVNFSGGYKSWNKIDQNKSVPLSFE